MFFICSTDRDIRRRERGGGEATGPRAVVYELTLARSHRHASAPRASLTPRPSLLSWPFDGTDVPSQYLTDTSNLKVEIPFNVVKVTFKPKRSKVGFRIFRTFYTSHVIISRLWETKCLFSDYFVCSLLDRTCMRCCRV